MPRGGNKRLANYAYVFGQTAEDPFHIHDIIEYIEKKGPNRAGYHYRGCFAPTPIQIAQVLAKSGYFNKVGTTRVKTFSGNRTTLVTYENKPLEEIIEKKITSKTHHITTRKNLPKFLKDEIKRRGL